MATFRAVADAPKGINEVDLFAPYTAVLLGGIFFSRFYESTANSYYAWPYFTGGSYPLERPVLQGNAFQFVYQAKKVGILGYLIGFKDFKLTFDGLNRPTTAEGSIRIAQTGLLVNGQYVDWWTFYDFELDAKEITGIGSRFLDDIGLIGLKAAKTTAISSLLNIYENLRNKDDEVYLTNRDDIFYTFGGDDSIDARRGSDDLHPGKGLDKIFCGAGLAGGSDGKRDQIYLIDTPAAGATTQPEDFLTDNKDTIYEFGLEDRIMVSSKALNLGIVFSKKKKSLKPPRKAGSEMIWYEEDDNSQFTDKTRFTYQASTGSLKFDSDGNGLTNAVEIATLYTGGAGSAPPDFSTASPLPLYFIL